MKKIPENVWSYWFELPYEQSYVTIETTHGTYVDCFVVGSGFYVRLDDNKIFRANVVRRWRYMVRTV